jgi:hypothetical protein
VRFPFAEPHPPSGFRLSSKSAVICSIINVASTAAKYFASGAMEQGYIKGEIYLWEAVN